MYFSICIYDNARDVISKPLFRVLRFCQVLIRILKPSQVHDSSGADHVLEIAVEQVKHAVEFLFAGDDDVGVLFGWFDESLV